VSDAHWSVIRHASVIGRDGGHGQPVLLEDVLGSFPELRINIDLKESAVVRPVADVIARTRSADRVCIGAFSGRRLAQIRALLGPDVATSMSPAEITRFVAAGRSQRAARYVSPVPAAPVAAAQVPASVGGRTIVDRAFVELAHERGVQVHVWTVDEPAQMNRLLDMGVDAIMTDRPSVLSELLRARQT
jgi:glycerophosphoryl diester phosphodiesterase